MPTDPWLALLESTHDRELGIKAMFDGRQRMHYWEARYERLAALVEPVMRASIHQRQTMTQEAAEQWVAAVDAVLARVTEGE